MYIIVIILCEEYLHTKAASKLLVCFICTFQNQSFLKKLKSFIKGFKGLYFSSLGCLGLLTLLSLEGTCICTGTCMYVCINMKLDVALEVFSVFPLLTKLVKFVSSCVKFSLS